MAGVPQATFAGAVPKVLVTVPALKPYVDELLTGITASQSLLKPGQSPHMMALSPSQSQALATADIILMADAGMSPFLARTLAARKKKGALVIELTELPGAKPLPYPTQNPWLTMKKKAPIDTRSLNKAGKEEEGDEEGHEAEGKHDPHVWLDPLRMAAIAQPLAVKLGEAAPMFKGRIAINAEALARHLRKEVHPALKAMIDRPRFPASMRARPYVPFVTYHASYQYFLARYGLEDQGYVTAQPVEYLGARSMRDLLAQSETVAITCIVSETKPSIVQRLADASGARVVLLNPERGYGPKETANRPWIKNDYDRLLYTVAATFADCLGK